MFEIAKYFYLCLLDHDLFHSFPSPDPIATDAPIEPSNPVSTPYAECRHLSLDEKQKIEIKEDAAHEYSLAC